MATTFGWSAEVLLDYPDNVVLVQPVYDAIATGLDARAPIFGLGKGLLWIKYGVNGNSENEAKEEASRLITNIIGQTGLTGVNIVRCEVTDFAAIDARVREFEDIFNGKIGAKQPNATIIPFRPRSPE